MLLYFQVYSYSGTPLKRTPLGRTDPPFPAALDAGDAIHPALREREGLDSRLIQVMEIQSGNSELSV